MFQLEISTCAFPPKSSPFPAKSSKDNVEEENKLHVFPLTNEHL